MNKYLLLGALEDALYLITEEYQSVIDVDLQKKYNEVINIIKEAIIEINKE